MRVHMTKGGSRRVPLTKVAVWQEPFGDVKLGSNDPSWGSPVRLEGQAERRAIAFIERAAESGK